MQPIKATTVKLQKEHGTAEHRRDGLPARKGGSSELQDWFESLQPALEFLLKSQEPTKTALFLDNLMDRLRESGIKVPHVVSTPYVNTIPAGETAGIPRRLANRGAHQEFHSLERHGHGRQRQSRP